MKLNTFLCGKVPLQAGVKAIGIYDVSWLILEVLLAIFAGATYTLGTYFTLPVDKQLAWVVVLKIVIVDLLRVCAFGLLLSKGDSERRLRLIMGVTRVSTQGLWVFLIAWSFKEMGVRAHWAKLILNIALLMIDLYFTAVIFSFYRTTTQEEIEIELKRLGQQRLDINVYRLEDFESDLDAQRQMESAQYQVRSGGSGALKRGKGLKAGNKNDDVIDLDHFKQTYMETQGDLGTKKTMMTTAESERKEQLQATATPKGGEGDQCFNLEINLDEIDKRLTLSSDENQGHSGQKRPHGTEDRDIVIEEIDLEEDECEGHNNLHQGKRDIAQNINITETDYSI